jgi:ADP-L-glycero-D-manno-heptose 6-epimerase
MILVTGGAGFIGSNLVASLNEQGVTDIAVNDHLGSQAKERNLNHRRYSGIVAPEELFPWLDGRKLEAVLHMGAISSTTETDEKLMMAANFELPMRLLDWCTATRTPFIYASSAATYGDGSQGFDDDDRPEILARLQPLNLYGRSKQRFDLAVVERARAKAPMPPQWAGLKFFNVFGPNEYHKADMRSVLCKSFPDARDGRPVRLFKSNNAAIPDGGQKRDFIYVLDAASVVLWLLGRPRVNGIYNVGTGEGRSFREMMLALFKALNRTPEIQYFQMPEPLTRQYQYLTQAKMERLRAAGYDAPFTPLETAVEDYVTRFLNRPDPYR